MFRPTISAARPRCPNLRKATPRARELTSAVQRFRRRRLRERPGPGRGAGGDDRTICALARVAEAEKIATGAEKDLPARLVIVWWISSTRSSPPELGPRGARASPKFSRRSLRRARSGLSRPFARNCSAHFPQPSRCAASSQRRSEWSSKCGGDAAGPPTRLSAFSICRCRASPTSARSSAAPRKPPASTGRKSWRPGKARRPNPRRRRSSGSPAAHPIRPSAIVRAARNDRWVADAHLGRLCAHRKSRRGDQYGRQSSPRGARRWRSRRPAGLLRALVAFPSQAASSPIRPRALRQASLEKVARDAHRAKAFSGADRRTNSRLHARRARRAGRRISASAGDRGLEDGPRDHRREQDLLRVREDIDVACEAWLANGRSPERLISAGRRLADAEAAAAALKDELAPDSGVRCSLRTRSAPSSESDHAAAVVFFLTAVAAAASAYFFFDARNRAERNLVAAKQAIKSLDEFIWSANQGAQSMAGVRLDKVQASLGADERTLDKLLVETPTTSICSPSAQGTLPISSTSTSPRVP